MTAVESERSGRDRFPITDFDELYREGVPAGWHFANYDAKRELAPVHVGLANGRPYALVTRMEDVRAALQTPLVFSNSAVSPAEPNPNFRWIPLMLDGQEHLTWRRLMGPYFSSTAVAVWQPKLRERFAEILDGIAAKGSCDFVHEVALLFPNIIFMDMFGLPRENAETFQQWLVEILHKDWHSPEGQKRQVAAMMGVVEYFKELIAQRRAEPRDDMLSAALGWEIDGEPVADQDLLDFCLLMFLAGLDTVAAQLTFSFWHLASHDDDRRRIVENAELIPGAIEEFLRCYSFVSPGRKVVQDTEIAGCPVKAGEMVYMPLATANRDPRAFDDAETVVIDRENNRHLAFGVGPHRCVGSYLARQELQIAFEMWHERIPNYRLVPGKEVHEHGGQIGIDSLWLEWDT